MSEHGTLEVQVTDRVATIRLANPAKRNAIDIPTAYAIGDAVTQLAADPAVRAIVITGDAKAFSSGADLASELTAEEQARIDDRHGDRDVHKMMPAVDHMVLSVVRAEVPVIAAVEGAAAGIGASLTFASDIIVASENAFFLLPFGRIGLVPDGAVIRTLTAAFGRQATMAMALRQERLSAADASLAGAIAQVTEPGEAYEAALKLAAEFTGSPRGALAATKAAVNTAAFGSIDSLEATLAEEARVQTALLGTPEHREGVQAFVEKRAPKFD